MSGVDWLRDQKWGVFTHFLYHEQNRAGSPTNMGAGETDWNDCVDGFDTEALAGALAKAGARYLVFTLMQGKRYLCAPNAAFDRITGCAPGEACSRRDLIADLIASLKKRGIALMLYYTGDGPHLDPVAGPRMGYGSQREKVTASFVENWASVAREYSLRYGSDVRGWWVDGCYEWLGYDDSLLGLYVPALKAGNPDAVVAFNGGVKPRVSGYSAHDDYTCGEMTDFIDVPDGRFIAGAQWHTLAPLGVSITGNPNESWCKPGCKRDGAYMRDYVRRVNEKGGVVTVDVALYRDGHLDPAQVDTLSAIGGEG